MLARPSRCSDSSALAAPARRLRPSCTSARHTAITPLAAFTLPAATPSVHHTTRALCAYANSESGAVEREIG